MTQALQELYKTTFDIFIWKWRAIRATKDEQVECLMRYKDWIDEQIKQVEG